MTPSRPLLTIGYWLTTVLIISYFLLANPSPVSAGIWQSIFGHDVNSRPDCSPLDHYVEGAYTQAPFEDDCSNYGFEVFAEAASQMKVTCTEVYSDFKVEGEDETNTAEFSINDPQSMDTRPISSLSETTDRRAPKELDQHLIDEAGSAFTQVNCEEGAKFISQGMTNRIWSYPKHISSRLSHCDWLFECYMGAKGADSDLEFVNDGNPMLRCVNPQKINVPGQGPTNEWGICMEAYEKLRATDQLTPQDYFEYYPDHNMEQYQEYRKRLGFTPAYYFYAHPEDTEFAKRFFCMDPFAIRARELMVVCTYKYPETEEREIATKQEDEVIQGIEDWTFDCQEIIIPPGLIAACQGIRHQSLALTPRTHYDQILTIADYGEANPNKGGTQGPLVWIRQRNDLQIFFDNLTKNYKAPRMRKYAERINAEGTCHGGLPGESERYGDEGITDKSGAMNMSAHVNWDDPNQGTRYPSKYIFTIAPNGYSKCLNQLLSYSPVNLAGHYVSKWFSDPKKITMLENPIDGSTISECTSYETDMGSPGSPPHSAPPYCSPGQSLGSDNLCHGIRCVRRNTESLQPGGADVEGGGLPEFSLDLAKCHWTSAYADNACALNYFCGWEEYKARTPPPPQCALGDDDYNNYIGDQCTTWAPATIHSGSCPDKRLGFNWGYGHPPPSYVTQNAAGKPVTFLFGLGWDSAADYANYFSDPGTTRIVRVFQWDHETSNTAIAAGARHIAENFSGPNDYIVFGNELNNLSAEYKCHEGLEQCAKDYITQFNTFKNNCPGCRVAAAPVDTSNSDYDALVWLNNAKPAYQASDFLAANAYQLAACRDDFDSSRCTINSWRWVSQQIGGKSPVILTEFGLAPGLDNDLTEVVNYINSNIPNGVLAVTPLVRNSCANSTDPWLILSCTHLNDASNHTVTMTGSSDRPPPPGTPLDPVPPPIRGNCPLAPGIHCNVDNLAKNYCKGNYTYAQWASQICMQESGGNPNVINNGCQVGDTYNFSVGLFQINLLPNADVVNHEIVDLSGGRCPGAFSLDVDQVNSAPGSCHVIDDGTDCSEFDQYSKYPITRCNQALKDCILKYQDPDENMKKMQQLSSDYSDVGPNDDPYCSVWTGDWEGNAVKCGLP